MQTSKRLTHPKARAGRAARILTVFGALSLVTTVALAQDGRVVLQEAPLDKTVFYPRAELEGLFKKAYDEKLTVVRMLEGGEFNVNIRHLQNVGAEPRTLVHPDTIDVWVVQEGTATLVTGAERVGERYVGGEERVLNVGDVVFIPAGVPHGVKNTEKFTWYNIRFPEHRN